jgi:hypothetical protein
VTRHLVGGGPERRDVLTECAQTEALPGSLVTDVEDVNCRACRASLIARGICPACGGGPLAWTAGIYNRTGVQNGLLGIHDVEGTFSLGCEECSETLIHSVDADVVARALTEIGWRPRA